MMREYKYFLQFTENLTSVCGNCIYLFLLENCLNNVFWTLSYARSCHKHNYVLFEANH